MKTIQIISAAILFAGIILSGCETEYIRIEGSGPVINRTLVLDDFSAIDMNGVDDVIISYGTEQNVTVKGHANIINRIQTEVRNDTWDIALENGNYGDYELTYYLTLPVLEEVVNTGTGNVIVNDFVSQDYLSVSIIGTGNFYGFPMKVRRADIDISGTGNCEISVEDRLDVNIEGSGDVYYKGYPDIHQHIQGSGSLHSMNN
jgi:hypothetical protein